MKKYGVICFKINRGGFFHKWASLSGGDVENYLKIVEKCGILCKEFEII